MSIGKLCKKELNFINLWDKLTENKEVEGLSGIDKKIETEYLVTQEELLNDLDCNLQENEI